MVAALHAMAFLRLDRALATAALAALAAAPLLALATLGSTGCGAAVATVLSADDGGPGTSEGGGGGGAACTADPQCNANPATSSLRGKCVAGTCVCEPGIAVTADGKCGDPTDGGTTTKPDATTPPVTGPVCYNDPGCNDNPATSTLLGKCTFGICVCNQSSYVQPSGKCGPTPPPDCTTQGGTCRQEPAICSAGELAGDQSTNMTCGDLIAAVCCAPATSCKGGVREVAGAGWVSVDFVCCAPNDNDPAPICVNGWKTCKSYQTPTSKPGGGC